MRPALLASVVARTLVAAIALSACALSHSAHVDGGVNTGDGTDSIDRADSADVRPDSPIEAGCGDASLFCQGLCFAPTDPRHCGTCANDCTVLPNVRSSAAMCDAGGTCAIHDACQTGYADCDNNPANGCETALGTSTNCNACSAACSGATPVCSTTGGTASCTNGCAAGLMNCTGTCADVMTDAQNCGTCGHACANVPNGQVSCGAGACALTCDAGFHNCGGACASNTSVMSCGAMCTACATPSNATATCNGATCGFTCNAGYHLCGGACVSDSDVATCGASCTPCIPPTNGTATCNGTACGFNCAANFHACGGQCYAESDPMHCGAACMSCAGPAGGMGTCVAGACGQSCSAGSHVCAGTCVNNTAVATCGASCTACPVPANATMATCNGTACGFVCATGYVQQGAGCVMSTPPGCGNGQLEASEQCDDGNTNNSDGCHQNCTVESGVGSDTCGGASTIVVSAIGTVYFRGTTVGAANNFASATLCAGDGPDVVYSFRVNVGRGFSYTARVMPSSSWDVNLRGDSACTGMFCADRGGAGIAESNSWTGADGSTIVEVVDGAGAGDSGGFVLSLTIM